MIAEPLCERRWWLIGIVGIVQVEPHEEWCARFIARPSDLRREPVFCQLSCPIAASFERSVGRAPVDSLKAIVVVVESARQARAPIEDEGTDKGRGSIATGVQRCGERRDISGHRKVAIVADT